ncbi:MAG: ribonuclease III [Butyrivibrio sp.]|nr:ribonuclease III [Butyrivibrio sp.]
MITLEELGELEQTIGYEFKNKALLVQAVTHSSFSNEQRINRRPHYERLEFLGDAVLEMVTSAFLYKHYPDKREGEMTRMRASMVCETALAYCAEDINLRKYLILGKGEEATGGRNRESIIADVMEALIGAVYLDGGIRKATAIIERIILSDLEHKQVFYDSKSLLQEWAQSCGTQPVYEVTGEEGPEHDKLYRVAVSVDGVRLGEGEGRNKKSAEQKAAYAALISIEES